MTSDTTIDPAGTRGFSPAPAEPVLLEIIEKMSGGPSDWDSPGGRVTVPTEIRLNGQPLMARAGAPVKIHEIEVAERDAVYVTITLIARRVVIGQEFASGEPDTRAGGTS